MNEFHEHNVEQKYQVKTQFMIPFILKFKICFKNYNAKKLKY